MLQLCRKITSVGCLKKLKKLEKGLKVQEGLVNVMFVLFPMLVVPIDPRNLLLSYLMKS